MSAVRKLVLGALCLSGLSACGTDLGECDETMLGGSTVPGMAMPFEGQKIVAESCSSGRCHSESAEGEGRSGAPHGLNFDVVGGSSTPEELAKITRGSATVVDWADDIWGEIEEGAMPPPKPAGSGELTAAKKESVRNWLACGAPVVAPDTAPPTATWNSIWTELAGDCIGCHNAASVGTFNTVVLGELGDACGSYANIMNPGMAAGMCAGQTLVVPGNPGASQLLLKLKAMGCGAPMPFGQPEGLVATKPELVGRIEQWIMNNAMPPTGCP